MQGRPPPRPSRPQEPRDFDPRLVDAPHSNHQQPQPSARLQPDNRRPSHEDPRARHTDQRAAGQGQGSRDRRSRHGDDDNAYGVQDDAWATSEEDSECRESTCTSGDSTDKHPLLQCSNSTACRPSIRHVGCCLLHVLSVLHALIIHRLDRLTGKAETARRTMRTAATRRPVPPKSQHQRETRMTRWACCLGTSWRKARSRT